MLDATHHIDPPRQARARSTAALRRFLRNPSAVVGALMVAAVLLAAAAAGAITRYDPNRLGDAAFAAPSARHWLGTDALGRDVYSRVLYGARLSLVAGVVAVSLAAAAGGTLGLLAGYAGGLVDAAIMRGVDVLLSFPGILIALLVVVALEPGWTAVMAAIAVINVPVFCRQLRAAVLVVRELDYVTAVRAAGATHAYILTRVILPAVAHPLAVLATLGLGTSILEVAGLAFLGVAGQVDVPEWGTMLQAAKETLNRSTQESVVPILAPGIAISWTVLGFVLLGDGLRDCFGATAMGASIARSNALRAQS